MSEAVSREVIEKKLLAALDDGAKVAIVASEEDLRLLIAALEDYICRRSSCGDAARAMVADLRTLKREAFGHEE